MGSPGSTPYVTQEDVLDVFTRSNRRGTPFTVDEIADEVGCTPQTAEAKLTELVDGSQLQTKRIGEGVRVWWSTDTRHLDEFEGDRQELRAFVNAVEDYAIFVLDPEGVIVSWNEGARRIKGYERDEIVGRHFSTFYTDEAIATGVPEGNLETATRRGRIEDEGWRVREDGTHFWANVTITAIHDDDGTLRGFIKVTRDMTERREYEERLRRERDLTERILETVPVSICVVSSEGEFVRANQRMLDRLGIEEADLDQYSVDSWTLYDEENEPIPTEEWPWKRVLETRAPVYEFQCQVELPGVGRRWLSIDAARIDDSRHESDHPEAERVVVSIDDVTDLRERERRLRRESDQTEKLLRTAPIAIAVQNAEGETIMANQRAQDALGLSEREFVEAPEDADEWAVYDGSGNRLGPEDVPSACVLASGEPVFDQELVFDPPSAERMYFRVNAAPIFDQNGSIERVVTAGEDITELKARERTLERRKAELEAELNEVLDRIANAFYALDDEWRFTHVNERASDILGHPSDELLGRRIWDVFPDASDVYRERFETAMETQEPVTFEVFATSLDAWLEFNVYPSESGLSIYFHDVTERKSREQTLTKYETIVETVNDGIYVKDDEGRFTMVNEAYAQLTGYDREELVGAHASLVVDEETIQRSRERMEQTGAADGVDPTMEATIETKGGERVPSEATFATIETGDGVSEHVGVVRDVTERKEYQRRIEESELRYRTLVEYFPDGIVALFDEELRYVAAGGALIDETGIERAEVIGETIYERYPDELLAEVEPHFVAALEGEERTFEVEYLGRNLRAHTLPVEPAGDERTGMLVVQDVTERKRYQRRLEDSNERLEQFAYAASHDLQEPLRMVSSYLQLVENRYGDVLDDEGREFIEFAVDGADRMRDMIEGLLQYSRVETQGDPFEPVDLDDVVAQVLDDLQLRIAESDADVSTASLPRAQGDPDQLRQVFQNLLDNAIEYSGDTPPRVHVDAEKEGEWWIVSVRDEGIGIDPTDADRIFEVFQRLHTHEEHRGIGIGLALCQRIVERHGGEIWVDSEPGAGSTFSVALPRTDPPRE